MNDMQIDVIMCCLMNWKSHFFRIRLYVLKNEPCQNKPLTIHAHYCIHLSAYDCFFFLGLPSIFWKCTSNMWDQIDMTWKYYFEYHSSEKKSFCLMKWPGKTLQNLPYFIYIWKPKVAFPFFISFYYIFFPNECPGLFRHRPGHSIGEKKSSSKWKMKETTLGHTVRTIFFFLHYFSIFSL